MPEVKKKIRPDVPPAPEEEEDALAFRELKSRYDELKAKLDGLEEMRYCQGRYRDQCTHPLQDDGRCSSLTCPVSERLKKQGKEAVNG